MGEGLLTRFLRERLAGHAEPTRRGTPRGALIGFSRKKLAAALFAVTNTDVKATAKELGVSYGVLRKWRTEPRFKALVERLEDEFVERFCAVVDVEIDFMDTGRDWMEEPRVPRPATAPVAGPLRRRKGPVGADVEQTVQMLYMRRAESTMVTYCHVGYPLCQERGQTSPSGHSTARGREMSGTRRTRAGRGQTSPSGHFDPPRPLGA